jgi:hypothetical protein
VSNGDRLIANDEQHERLVISIIGAPEDVRQAAQRIKAAYPLDLEMFQDGKPVKHDERRWSTLLILTPRTLPHP